jgi:hypothetical protein
METRSKSKPPNLREVLPTESKVEEVKFGSAKTWGRKELKLLGVNFQKSKRIDLNSILGVKESEWPEEVQKRILLPCKSNLCRSQKMCGAARCG